MKKLIAILLVMIALTGCGTSKKDAFADPERFRIESGGDNIGLELVTDRETGVQYLYNTHTGTFTVLLDHDGNPYIANGWRDYDDR